MYGSLYFPDRHYGWIGPPVETHEKSIAGKMVRAKTIPRPPFESSWQEEPKSALTIFVKFIFDLFFQNNFPNIVQRQIVKVQLDSPRRILVC